MGNLLKAWEATFTRRWHTHCRLGTTGDTNAGHQGRVALLTLLLFPTARPEVLKAAVIHDLGEAAVGDIAWGVKHRNPDLAKGLYEMEQEHIKTLGFNFPDLTDKEKLTLDFCDWLDAYLWVKHHDPIMLYEQAWEDFWVRLGDMAKKLNVWEEFKEITL